MFASQWMVARRTFTVYYPQLLLPRGSLRLFFSQKLQSFVFCLFVCAPGATKLVSPYELHICLTLYTRSFCRQSKPSNGCMFLHSLPLFPQIFHTVWLSFLL